MKGNRHINGTVYFIFITRFLLHVFVKGCLLCVTGKQTTRHGYNNHVPYHCFVFTTVISWRLTVGIFLDAICSIPLVLLLSVDSCICVHHFLLQSFITLISFRLMRVTSPLVFFSIFHLLNTNKPYFCYQLKNDNWRQIELRQTLGYQTHGIYKNGFRCLQHFQETKTL